MSTVEYKHDGTRLVGYACTPADQGTFPAVLPIHDAYGVSEDMIGIAHRLAFEGHPVFVADVWGEGLLPREDSEIGPLIGAMVADRGRWLGRIAAAHQTLSQQTGFANRKVVLLGYCFGGSAALEYLRTGAQVAGVASIHGGLDLLADGWSAARPTPVLACTGSEDPMATAEMLSALPNSMTRSGMDWQTHLYSGTRHAFTSPKAAHSAVPEVVAYNPVSAARAWDATLRFLRATTS